MMHDEAIIVGATAALTRNYADLPFDAAVNPDTAGRVISRTAGALQEEGYTLRLLREMNEDHRRTLVERGHISGEGLAQPQTGAVMLPPEGPAAVTLGGTEHVAIRSRRRGGALQETVADCLRVEDSLSRRVSFAFHDRLGYLQACHEGLGTGLHAGLVMHLPLLMHDKRLPAVLRELAEQGLQGRPCGLVAGKHTPGCLLALSNRSAMGRTEQGVCQLVQQGAEKLLQLETELRREAAESTSLRLRDRLHRAQGLTQSALLMDAPEFWRVWSDLRLGAHMALLPLTVEQVDALLPEMLDGHLCSYAEEHLAGEALAACRCSRLRELLYDIPLEDALH